MNIIDMITHAYKTVPFYNNRLETNKIPDTVEDIPILYKYEMNCDVNSFISSNYISKYRNKELMWERTSGSTGISSEIYWDYREYKRSLLCLWIYRRKFYGITPKDKLVFFIPSDYYYEDCLDLEYRKGISKRFIIEDRIKEAYMMIFDYNPTWMILQPSIAVLLCEEAREFGRTIDNLKYIELTGEYLTEETRKIIKETFHCKIANQYGTKEVNSIAYECPYGNMHIMEDNVLVECLDLDDINKSLDKGHIIVTSKHNKAMPILRLDTGDVGSITRKVSCKCGVESDIITLRQGRSNDSIVMLDNTKKNPYIFFQVLNYINYITEGTILQYQIVQKSIFEFIVYLVVNDEFDDSIIEMIYNEFICRLGYDINLRVVERDRILPEYKTGKLASFICDISNK